MNGSGKQLYLSYLIRINTITNKQYILMPYAQGSPVLGDPYTERAGIRKNILMAHKPIKPQLMVRIAYLYTLLIIQNAERYVNT